MGAGSESRIMVYNKINGGAISLIKGLYLREREKTRIGRASGLGGDGHLSVAE